MKSMQAVLFAILICDSVTGHAGVAIEFVTRNATTGKEEPLQTMWIQNGAARMEAKRGTTSIATIFKNETLYVLDDGSKSYRAVDKKTMEQAAGAMNDTMTKMREQMAKMPPEQRAMMEQMMKQRGGAMAAGPQKPAVFDAQPTGGKDTVNGKSCQLWNVTRDGVLAQQLCVVPMSAMPGADEVITLSKKMAAMFEGISPQMRDATPSVQQSTATLSKINGYPIMTRSYRDGVLQPDMFVVKSWQQLPIESGKFEIPVGYKKQEMPQIPAR